MYEKTKSSSSNKLLHNWISILQKAPLNLYPRSNTRGETVSSIYVVGREKKDKSNKKKKETMDDSILVVTKNIYRERKKKKKRIYMDKSLCTWALRYYRRIEENAIWGRKAMGLWQTRFVEGDLFLSKRE